MKYSERKTLAYFVGVALGDGNLSNPNGRAVRLRITGDTKYPKIKEEIVTALKLLFPKNRVSIIQRKKTFYDISIYSNRLPSILPWKPGKGTKIAQRVCVPRWILTKQVFVKACLRGLIQTDGSIYLDRGYLMVNFTNSCKPLATDVFLMMKQLGFSPNFSTINEKGKVKHVVRVARESKKFCTVLALKKE